MSAGSTAAMSGDGSDVHMINPRDDITGLILAGGRGSRMGGVDKGLQLYLGSPARAARARRLRPQVGASWSTPTAIWTRTGPWACRYGRMRCRISRPARRHARRALALRHAVPGHGALRHAEFSARPGGAAWRAGCESADADIATAYTREGERALPAAGVLPDEDLAARCAACLHRQRRAQDRVLRRAASAMHRSCSTTPRRSSTSTR